MGIAQCVVVVVVVSCHRLRFWCRLNFNDQKSFISVLARRDSRRSHIASTTLKVRLQNLLSQQRLACWPPIEGPNKKRSPLASVCSSVCLLSVTAHLPNMYRASNCDCLISQPPTDRRAEHFIGLAYERHFKCCCARITLYSVHLSGH